MRVPCYIQLLGEHYSDSGFGNISFCGEQDTVIAFQTNKANEIIINHMIQASFPTRKISSDLSQKFDEHDEYLNLFLIGFKAALQSVNPEQRKQLPGVKILVDTNFPKRRGLGQSNSISLAAMLVAMHSYKIKLSYQQIIDNLWKYKTVVKSDIPYRFQETVILMSEKQSFQALNPDSLKQEQIAVPPQFCFVIADSLTNDPTLMTGGKRKDLRNCEVRIAIRLLLQGLNLQQQDLNKFRTLKEVMKLLDYNIDELIEAFSTHVQDRLYKTDELEEIFEMPLGAVLGDIPYVEKVLGVNNEFHPFR